MHSCISHSTGLLNELLHTSLKRILSIARSVLVSLVWFALFLLFLCCCFLFSFCFMLHRAGFIVIIIIYFLFLLTHAPPPSSSFSIHFELNCQSDFKWCLLFVLQNEKKREKKKQKDMFNIKCARFRYCMYLISNCAFVCLVIFIIVCSKSKIKTPIIDRECICVRVCVCEHICGYLSCSIGTCKVRAL